MALSKVTGPKIVKLEKYGHYQLVDSLQTIVDAILKYTPAYHSMIREFPGFEKVRVLTLQSMGTLADNLDTHHWNCNVATIVGTSAGIAGGIVAIVGATLLTVATAGAAAPVLAIAGGATATAGGLSSFGTSITERIIEKTELKTITKLLEEDKAYFEKVFPWIQRTEELEKTVEDLMDYNVFHEMMVFFVNDPGVAGAIEREQPMQELPQGIKTWINNLDSSPDQKRRLKELVLDIFRSVECLNLFRKIFNFFVKMHRVLSKAYEVFRTVATCLRAADASYDVGNVVFNIARNAKPAARLTAAFGIVAAVAVAIDIVVLVSTSRDMANGSKSALACKTRHTAELLQDELNTLRKIHDKLVG